MNINCEQNAIAHTGEDVLAFINLSQSFKVPLCFHKHMEVLGAISSDWDID